LMTAKALAKQPSRPTPSHRISNLATGHHSQTTRSAGWQGCPVRNQTTLDNTLTRPSNLRKIPAPTNPAVTSEGQPRRGSGGGAQTGVRRLRPARRRFARMARPLLLLFRARKPCCLLRVVFDG
jgi:hypothetical protein